MSTQDLVPAGWLVRVANVEGSPWTFITDDVYSKSLKHDSYEFKRAYTLDDGVGHKLSSDKTTMVSVTNEFKPIDSSTPLGVKVQCLNEGNVAIYSVITEATKKLYKGWCPLPKIPKSMR